MKTLINVDKVGPTLATLIQEELAQQGLPICFGNMIPPLTTKVAWFESDEICTTDKTRPASELDHESSNVLLNETFLSNGFVLTKVGVEQVQNYKIKQAHIYAAQLLQCSRCPITEICYKLTKNYLRLVALKEGKTNGTANS